MERAKRSDGVEKEEGTILFSVLSTNGIFVLTVRFCCILHSFVSFVFCLIAL